MARYEDLKAIENRDPDGGEREPTHADYAAHEAWAVATFGRNTWAQYRLGGWAHLAEPGGGYYGE